MVRTILGLIAGMVLAFIGVFFFAWVLWWLWTRLSPDKGAVSIEIEVQPPETKVEPPVVAEAGEEPAAKIPPESATAKRQTASDDLKRIEGIGPKFSSILQEAGILTYSQLAAASTDELESILAAVDPRLLRLADPVAWREQAALAATGEWEALEALQGTLKGGRRA